MSVGAGRQAEMKLDGLLSLGISATSTPPLHVSSAGDDAFLLFCGGAQLLTSIWEITFNEMSPINTGPCIFENLKRAMDSFFTEK